jgi:hypothetical protein
MKTLAYAERAVMARAAAAPLGRWVAAVLALAFAASALLCASAIRWDRWARYENTQRPWWDGFGGESYSSFKAWRAWRSSWERARAAAAVSGAAVVAGVAVALRGRSGRGLVVTILLHAVVLGYFIVRWGPDFRHPAAHWGG